MVKIELQHVSKSYGKLKALEDISLQIDDKEYFIILGPTGAGKTTLLKIIAGLIKPDTGKVLFDGKDVTNLPPGQRKLGFVFENYALFPNMTVLKNISYSGRVNDRDRKETNAIADQVLRMTLLKGRDNAMPSELSGGMQQRVALSRALMNLEETGLLMLDEPLKALDAGLRMNLRSEIRNMAKSKYLLLTAIHVTNEMEEAMMVADRIAVLNDGKLIQVGTPYELYYRPVNLFVANFMSEINYFDAICLKDNLPDWVLNDKSPSKDPFFAKIQNSSSGILLKIGINVNLASFVDNCTFNLLNNKQRVLLVVRSNHMKLRLGDRIEEKHNALPGVIKRRKFMGVWYRFEVLANINNNKKIVVVTIPATTEIHRNFVEGKSVTVYFPKELGIVFKHPGDNEVKKIMRLE